MPRTGPRRQGYGVRLSADEHKAIEDLAKVETGGNFSDMVRKLVDEALTARAEQAGQARSRG